MFLIASSEEGWGSLNETELNEAYGKITSWWDDHTKAGRLLEGHQLKAAETATTVRNARDGSTSVTDGPFIEAKEMVGGYGIVEVADLDEAIALASSWPAPDTIEIRPLIDGPSM